MSKRAAKLTYDEIDQLLEESKKASLKDIKWKIVTEEEIESLLQKPLPSTG